MKRKISILLNIVMIIGLICIALTNSNRTDIANMASLALADGWSMEELQTTDNYAYVRLLYQAKAVAAIEVSRNTEESWVSEDTSAESFTNIYLGMHAELIESSKFALKDNTFLTKLVANPGMSAAESAGAEGQPADEIWYFGVSGKEVFISVQLLDRGMEGSVEEILKTLH